MAANNTSNAFDFAVAKVLQLEGLSDVVTQDPIDPGGRTIYGISERANPDLWRDGPPSLDRAKERYRERYWTPCGCDYLPLPVALVAFDMAVNAGVTEAVTMLQRLVGTMVDGHMGPATISKARRFADRLLAEAYQLARKDFYQNLARTKPEEQKFLLGWLNRLRSMDETLQGLT